MFLSAKLIYIAVLIDLILGDPQWSYHPIRIIGKAINSLEPIFRKLFPNNLKLAGTLLSLLVIGTTFLSTQTLLYILALKNIKLAIVADVLLIYFSISINALAKEGWLIAKTLRTGNLASARSRIKMLVSRNLDKENHNGLIRACIETLTENISDGVIAPLLFAMLGGGPLAMTYKAINTLDSMIGYKNEKYIDFGRFAAKLDDAVNFVPARITGALIVIISLITFHNPIRTIQAWIKDAQKGPSPNGGIPIVTFAGMLNISLGGDCFDSYGHVISIPYVGGTKKVLQIRDIYWAIATILLSAALLLVGYSIINLL